ncbi:RING-H2 finger protein ATL16 [Tanacetum coccineum]
MEHKYDHESPHASFPIIAVAIIGIFATIFVLVFYYIFVIKCCLNWHRIDILRRFSLSRSRSDNHNYHQHHPTSSELPKGLDESVIRLIPIFKFQKKQNDSDNECAVCLAEFQDNEKLRMIPNCAHVFHIDCIDIWLQNNPNCPLCRNSISISIPSHYPVPEHIDIDTSPPALCEDNDYVVIELCSDDVTLNSREPAVPKKTGKNIRKNHGHVVSMGDECIDVNTRRKDDEQFNIQPIRRSFSMDSASDRQLLLAVQEIIQRNSMNHDVDASEVNDGSSSNRLRRGFFSFGHARSAILPFHILDS